MTPLLKEMHEQARARKARLGVYGPPPPAPQKAVCNLVFDGRKSAWTLKTNVLPFVQPEPVQVSVPEPVVSPPVLDVPAEEAAAFQIVWNEISRIGHIQRRVAAEYGLRVDDLKSNRRIAKFVRPRHVAMYLVKQLYPKLSYPEIGRKFGGRDHTTVMHACRKVAEDIQKDTAFNYRVAMLRLEIEGKTMEDATEC